MTFDAQNSLQFRDLLAGIYQFPLQSALRVQRKQTETRSIEEFVADGSDQRSPYMAQTSFQASANGKAPLEIG